MALILFLTIPQLELMGAIIGGRLLDNIIEGYLSLAPFGRTQLGHSVRFILDPRRIKSFVRNRVSEIQKLTNPRILTFCPGDTAEYKYGRHVTKRSHNGNVRTKSNLVAIAPLAQA